MTVPAILRVLFLALLLSRSSAAAPLDAGQEPDRDDRVGLADLAAYRTALSGRATADEARPSDPPVRVGFRDLWGRPEAYRGRRVTVRGRLERTFRQGPVGNFPPLVEAWIFSASGDPFCVVYPRPDDAERGGPPGRSPVDSAVAWPREARRGLPAAPEPGRLVGFTGTFLKTIRYAGGDGERLAPLIVGDRPPESRPPGKADGDPAATAKGADDVLRALGGGAGGASPAADRRSEATGSVALALGLAAVAALVIAGQHLRGARLRHRATHRRRLRDPDGPDLPLQFIEPHGEA